MGDGNSRLDGIRFLEADTHGFTSVGSFWNNVTLSDLFSGQSTISSNSPNGHIIRHVWDGLVNGETYEPVFLKLSSMHIQASQAYQEIKRIQLRHQGLNPSASDVMNSIIKSVVRSLGTTTICGATGIALGPAYGPVCSVTMSGITATVDAYSTPPGDDYFYKLHVGPLVFKYGIADSEIGSDGKWSGESVYWGIE